MKPGQIIEVLKGVFGLSTSPKLWWMKLSTDLQEMKVNFGKEELHFERNIIDPCIFMLKGNGGGTQALLLTHVDDIMLMAEENLLNLLRGMIKEKFPVDEWENNKFEYVGCEYECHEDHIHIHQQLYATSRVDKVNVPPDADDEQLANAVQKEENRTAIGRLSWLAKQTRPDLQFAVCQAQRKQQNPTIKDLKDTNKIILSSQKFKENGIRLRKIEEENMCILAYHDAAWGNVGAEVQEEGDEQWLGSHNTASQLASLTLVADKKCLTAEGGAFSVVDWKSKASQRVCRSTFAGETMARCEAFENSLYLRSLLLSITTGQVFGGEEAGKKMEVHLVTDCRSLYDHIHREGVPRAPSEKRLAIDLAGLRHGLMNEAWHQWRSQRGMNERPTPQTALKPPLHWLPTGDQLADVLTKSMNPTEWWAAIAKGWLNLPLKV